MQNERRAGLISGMLLVVAVLLPYGSLLIGRSVPIPDDVFVSDLVDGELPARVEAARIFANGEAPVWTPRISSGLPLSVDPISLLLFRWLPPPVALGWLVALLLSVAALGTYRLCRQHGGDRAGAFLAGFAFAWSGFFVCQLRHLGVMSTVAYFPLALWLLDTAATGGTSDRDEAREVSTASRLARCTGFAAVFGLQILGGFPQSAYICAIFYAALVMARALWLASSTRPMGTGAARWRPAFAYGFAALAAAAVGVLIGMASLLPMHELGTVSARSTASTFLWATRYPYWPRNILTFFVPYVNGDISDGTYGGPSLFWEDYGYVGLATVLLAAFASITQLRRFAVAFWTLVAMVAFGMVLGRHLPLYRLAFDTLPGLSRFRFPTRFLFVVELALAVLGGLGLGRLRELLAARWTSSSQRRLIHFGVVALVTASAVQLVYANRRQNPMADAERWFAAPRSARVIQASGEGGRVFAPGTLTRHQQVFMDSHGWSGSLERYYGHREFLQPNSNLLHGVSTVDGYSGLSPRWTSDVVGDHNQAGFLMRLWPIHVPGFRLHPGVFDWLEVAAVRWVLLPFRMEGPRIVHVASSPPAEIHRLPGALPRARMVTRARLVPSLEEVWHLTLTRELDLSRQILLHEAAAARVVERLPEGESIPPGAATIVVDEATRVVVRTSAPRGGLLSLADTYYPGWVARVDGREVPIFRANVMHRAVEVPAGNHVVTFRFESSAVSLGLALSASGVGILLLSVLGILRSRRRPTNSAPVAPPRERVVT